jgi:transcriptional regulator with XRE-family HTH domain
MKDLAADLLESQGVQIGESMLSRIENGQTELRLGNLHAIATALRVDISELLRMPARDHHPLGVLDDPRLLYRVRQLRATLDDEQIRISIIQFIDLLLLMEKQTKDQKELEEREAAEADPVQ